VAGLEAGLRRLRPERVRRLTPRGGSGLARLDEEAVRRRAPVLLDTTVYVDVLRETADPMLAAALRSCPLWHCTVSIGELARGLGAADPDRRGYQRRRDLTAAYVARIPEHRVIGPDREAFELAGIASGTLARVLGLDAAALARHGNDALLFFAARKHGLAVLTRNARDFDLLQQLDPEGKVLVY
jgi:predicted nucleic acid-binding protein